MKKVEPQVTLKPIGTIKFVESACLIKVSKTYKAGLLHLDKFSHGLIFYGDKNRLSYGIGVIEALDMDKGTVTIAIDNQIKDKNDECLLYDIKPYFPVEDYIPEGNRCVAETIGTEATLQDEDKISQIGHYYSIKEKQYLKLSQKPEDIEQTKYYRVFWWSHRFDKPRYRSTTQCKPPYEQAPKTGIFATRSPIRPNLIATTVVKKVGSWCDDMGLPVAGFDGFEDTPIIGVYPYEHGVTNIEDVVLPAWLNHWPRKKTFPDPSEAMKAFDLTASGVEQLYNLMDNQRIEAVDNLQSDVQDGLIHDLDHNLLSQIIRIKEAKQNNLKNVSLDIPKNKITVITGISGSGKSSLAFDTIHKESQRQFMDVSGTDRGASVEKPDVEKVFGLMPSIAIEQKALGNNPRSTVGSVSGVAEYLKMLYVAIGVRHCPECHRPIEALSEEGIIHMLCHIESGHKVRLDASDKMPENEKRPITAISGTHGYEETIKSFVKAALRNQDKIYVTIDDTEVFELQTKAYCYHCDRVFFDLTASMFGYNNPEHMCPRCKGLGNERVIDASKVIDNPEKSVLDGASKVWGNLRKHAKKPNANWMRGEVLALALDMGVDLELPYKDLPDDFKQQLLYGSGDRKVTLEYDAKGRKGIIERPAEGVMNIVKRLVDNNSGKTGAMATTIESFMSKGQCTLCDGERLAAEGRLIRVGKKRYPEAAAMTIDDLRVWLSSLYETLRGTSFYKAKPILVRLLPLLTKISDVGLGYISLDRSIPTLSGGEGQRLRLASQFGTNLTNILYVMDEPSMGLHPSDYKHLAEKIMELRDNGNTIVMVEHEVDMIKIADHIVDVGPGAGRYGGEVVANGTVEALIHNKASITGPYLEGEHGQKGLFGELGVTNEIEKNTQNFITLSEARTHNLKNVELRIPLNKMTCVTGVSGSGKSSLIADTFVPALSKKLGLPCEVDGHYGNISGYESINGLVEVTQQPIGRTPRSNPATYSGVFDLIRQIYAALPLAKERGYKKEHFSFNSAKGQCPHCNGAGQVKTVMSFMPDIWTTCYVCGGSSYQKEILEITFNGFNISQLLDLEIGDVLPLFKGKTKVTSMLQSIIDVGLSYIKLGQSATTLSGGEAQRLKLAKALASNTSNNTLYVFDEPTTGLHLKDTHQLIKVMKSLVDKGNTVIVVEHNLSVIARADHIIDMGPEGGNAGGCITFEGSLSEIIKNQTSKTGLLLHQHLQ